MKVVIMVIVSLVVKLKCNSIFIKKAYVLSNISTIHKYDFLVKKSGRYTHQQRTEHTEEVQKLELSTKMLEGRLLDDEKRVQELEALIRTMTDMFMEKPSNQQELAVKHKHMQQLYKVSIKAPSNG